MSEHGRRAAVEMLDRRTRECSGQDLNQNGKKHRIEPNRMTPGNRPIGHKEAAEPAIQVETVSEKAE